MGILTPWEAVDRPRWMDDAPCKGKTDLFFPGIGENSKIREAKAICRACPYNIDCLEHALEFSESLAGIWGGTTGRQRVRIRQYRKELLNDFPE